MPLRSGEVDWPKATKYTRTSVGGSDQSADVRVGSNKVDFVGNAGRPTMVPYINNSQTRHYSTGTRCSQNVSI